MYFGVQATVATLWWVGVCLRVYPEGQFSRHKGEDAA